MVLLPFIPHPRKGVAKIRNLDPMKWGLGLKYSKAIRATVYTVKTMIAIKKIAKSNSKNIAIIRESCRGLQSKIIQKVGSAFHQK